MTKIIHTIYLYTLSIIVIITFISLGVKGISYYTIPLEGRFYNNLHDFYKPSGIIGHGLGIVGSAALIIGVFGYMARKRIKKFARIGYLKHWLEFHIFLCSFGPVLILYHTSFKFGGIVAISFWSMIAVVVSGIIGRFIYLQIPRTIEGREMSLNEINLLKSDLSQTLINKFNIDKSTIVLLETTFENNRDSDSGITFFKIISDYKNEKAVLKKIKRNLKIQKLASKDYRHSIHLIKNEMVLNRRIKWLVLMQNLLRYWHVAHLPFALIMLAIMIVHVTIALMFGYKWVF